MYFVIQGNTYAQSLHKALKAIYRLIPRRKIMNYSYILC